MHFKALCATFRNFVTRGFMSELIRFGISLDNDLQSQFDALISTKGYANRSEAIRDLIRAALVEDEWNTEDNEVVGTITLIYDHHFSDFIDRLTGAQHDHMNEIVSTMHVHLDHHNCLEVLAVRGKPAVIKKLADGLIGMKGVKHGKLVTTTTGRHLK